MNDMDLAKRAVACEGWRWMDGMGDGTGWRYTGGDVFAHILPDLTDPATLGCLLALVREAWASPTVYVRPYIQIGVWRVWEYAETRSAPLMRSGVVYSIKGNTEAEALVSALEVAP